MARNRGDCLGFIVCGGKESMILETAWGRDTGECSRFWTNWDEQNVKTPSTRCSGTRTACAGLRAVIGGRA